MNELERKFLDNYYCVKCGEVVFLEDGFWACGCYQIGAYELDIGYHELPRFWIKDHCSGCGEEIHRPYGSVIRFLGTINHLCSECTRESNK